MAVWTWKGLKRGIVSTRYPDEPLLMPEGYRGKPEIDVERCTPTGCMRCAEACLPKAITWQPDGGILAIDYARCVFCGLCEEVCPDHAITLTREVELAARTRRDLTVQAHLSGEEPSPADEEPGEAETAARLGSAMRRVFGRSLHIRHVDAGSCNGCESELQALNNPYYNLHRLGIFFTPSPRFADLLLVTGPVTRAMEPPLRLAYEAMPEPKLVVAAGTCACSGGIFPENALTMGGVEKILPVDVYIPGCPPPPVALMRGLLLAVGRAEQNVRRTEIVK
jgi:Ni,Fe-hydrogenase III small subunit/formate hydrogenlyase subunit 6/NADH:ubiquinone oxidoreductase subunit I